MSAPQRIQQHRRYLMCRPDHFTVSYQINPWMHPTHPTDTARAVRQWQTLYDTYRALGHQVDLIEPIPGLNDMVYTANGGLVIDGVALGARFRVRQRRGEEGPFREWFATHGFRVVAPIATQEGEGDLMLVGDTILAGHGFRSELASNSEVAGVFGLEVVSLCLINPAYYHLDTALCVLDPVQGPGGVDRANIAYRPAAFDAPSRAVLAERFPDAIRLPATEPESLDLNALSDGRNVFIAPYADNFAAQLRERGYHPVPVDMSELHLGGGGIKCCTLELRGARS
ncbi:dimethylargininase [Granulicoccus phenolivorans]|uniref:dimethylargininase n=1 Tax=Granulicoccus phenolivorans TaxID=266854 RepID=UPI00041D2C19|nr:dimethylargininase [Granulicoccus phenolivorans]